MTGFRLAVFEEDDSFSIVTDASLIRFDVLEVDGLGEAGRFIAALKLTGVNKNGIT